MKPETVNKLKTFALNHALVASIVLLVGYPFVPSVMTFIWLPLNVSLISIEVIIISVVKLRVKLKARFEKDVD